MSNPPPPPPEAPAQSFAYQAQSLDGQSLSGTIDAQDVAAAQSQLTQLGLRVLQIEPAREPTRPKALRGTDFVVFNQQLAQLTAAGLPLESGLRLIAQDMRSGRLAATVRRVADDLERGRSLAEAFDAHRGQFPLLYGRLVEAGVRSNNLSGMLFGLARHLEMTQRLRTALWRVVAYPLVLLAVLALVLGFISLFIVPLYRDVFVQFGASFDSSYGLSHLPLLTQWLFMVSQWLPLIAAVLVAVAVLLPLVWRQVQALRRTSPRVDGLVLGIPLIGPILRQDLVARWCDALRLGVEAGLDLPQAMELAGEACGSALLHRDGAALGQLVQSGQPLQAAPASRVLPATVKAAIDLGSRRGDLSGLLGSSSQLHQEQAEMRLSTLPVVLTPVFLLVLASLIGLVITALLLPLVSMLQSLTGGGW